MSGQNTDDEIFFLGAGASVAAGVPTTFGFVEAFKSTLSDEHETRVLEDILRVLRDWRGMQEGISGGADVELLLETMERLANLDQDVLARFLRLPESKSLDPVEVGILSGKLRNFIRKKGEVAPGKVAYLQPLFGFKKGGKPLDVFSVNYDIAVEQLCNVNKKRYVDGFDFEWNRKNFERTDVDVRLYKLHGSIMWYRTDTGSYVKIPVTSLNARTELITGETAETLILYPMRKWEYEEPLQELLMELKNRLESVGNVTVAGYSFRDDHIRRVFWDAARRNRQFILILVGPDCRDVYQTRLRYYDKRRVVLDESPNQLGLSLPVDSELAGRTICLPYEFEKVLPYLKTLFFPYVRLGYQVERNRLDRQMEGQEVPDYWISELQYFLDCSHIDKVEEIDQQINLDSMLSEKPSDAIGICLRALTTYSAYADSSRCKIWKERLEATLARLSVKIEEGGAQGTLTIGFSTPTLKWASAAEVLQQNAGAIKRVGQLKSIVLESRLEAAADLFEWLTRLESQLGTWASIKEGYQYTALRGKLHRNEVKRFQRALSRHHGSKNPALARKAAEILAKIELSELAGPAQPAPKTKR